jgi:two-component system, OmpR family, response regulator
MRPDGATTRPGETTELTLGPVRLCRERRQVWVGGDKVTLTPKEFDLLGYLMERPGRPVSRDDLLADVWGFLSPGDTRTIEVHIGHVRRKLGLPDFIRTVRGVGYEAVSP